MNYKKLRYCFLVVGIVLTACGEDSKIAERDAKAKSVEITNGKNQLTGLAQQAKAILAKLAEEPDSSKHKEKFLSLFRRIYSENWSSSISPETNTVYGQVFVAAHSYAKRGDRSFIEAVMIGSQGPYGRTAEGAEWLNEMLWEYLQTQTSETLEVLASLPDDLRGKVIENEFLHPVHDGFDFAKIKKNIEKSKIQSNIKNDVSKILALLDSNLGQRN